MFKKTITVTEAFDLMIEKNGIHYSVLVNTIYMGFIEFCKNHNIDLTGEDVSLVVFGNSCDKNPNEHWMLNYKVIA